jgi:hypothetical protein
METDVRPAALIGSQILSSLLPGLLTRLDFQQPRLLYTGFLTMDY